jgi:hypothetical protein
LLLLDSIRLLLLLEFLLLALHLRSLSLGALSDGSVTLGGLNDGISLLLGVSDFLSLSLDLLGCAEDLELELLDVAVFILNLLVALGSDLGGLLLGILDLASAVSVVLVLVGVALLLLLHLLELSLHHFKLFIDGTVSHHSGVLSLGQQSVHLGEVVFQGEVVKVGPIKSSDPKQTALILVRVRQSRSFTYLRA